MKKYKTIGIKSYSQHILKNENGGITILVLVSVLFMVSFLITSYVITANKVQTQKEIIQETRKIYESPRSMEEIYNSYFDQYGIIPIYTVEQLLAIGTGEKLTINGKTYTFSNDAVYLLKNDIEFDLENYELDGWDSPMEDEFFEGIFEWEGHSITIKSDNIIIAQYDSEKTNKIRSNQKLQIGENIFNIENLISKVYIKTNGETETAQDWSSSDYMYIGDYNKIIVTSDTNDFLGQYNAIYDEQKNFLRNIHFTKTTVNNKTIGDIELSIAVIDLQENEKYLRISEHPSVLKHIKIFPVDKYNGVLKIKFNPYINIDNYTMGDNVFNTQMDIIVNTYIDNNNGNELAYNGWDSTNYIYIGNYDKIIIASEKGLKTTKYNAMYDIEKNYVSSFNFPAGNTNLNLGNYYIVDIPQNVSYLRLSSNASSFNNMLIFPLIENNDNDETYGNENAIVGNSIINKETFINDTYINTSGGETSYSNWTATDFIDTSNYKGALIKNNKSDIYNAFYDSSRTFFRSINFSDSFVENDVIGKVGANIHYLLFNDNHKYFRLSNKTENLNNVEIYPVLDDINGFIDFKVK